MKFGRFDTIEGRAEVAQSEVIADVRNRSQIIRDWLIFPKNFGKALFVLAGILVLLPALLPLVLFVLLVIGEQYAQAAQYAPMRYPAWVNSTDPGQLHAATDKPTAAAGIMYFGIIDAKDPYTRSLQVFLSADDLKRHMLVLGTTGSGKSEFLKAMTFNVLCWASGFFVADAKADNKLPTDLYSQVVMFGRDYDFLVLNYLLGGLSPAQIASMRERLSNGVQPATVADADTLVQMTSNMMVKASGDGKSWQERGLNMYRGICRAVVDKRDKGDLTLSLEVLREYLALEKIEELYVEGWKAAQENNGIWPGPYLGVKSYLEVGLPGFKIDIMMRKFGLEVEEESMDMMAALQRTAGPPKAKPTTQSNDTFNQHGYRADQVYPALSLVVDTYGHIFKRKHPEIDMQDVVVDNRILVSLIPSLEKGAQEQESLGKLNLALLRVMMARALGMSVEGDSHINVDAKITESPTPFALFLDEFAYQFAEGIALTAAQARSLNFFLCALAQDLEKLTEGERMAEAGAMMANQATKFFMKIVGSEKTHDLAQKTMGEATVAVVSGYEIKQDTMLRTIGRDKNFRIEKKPRIDRGTFETFPSGFAAFSFRLRAHIMRTFYPSSEVPRVRFPRINRFLQMPDINRAMLVTCAFELKQNKDTTAVNKVRSILDSGEMPQYPEVVMGDVVQSIIEASNKINSETPAIDRGITLYQAAVDALHRSRIADQVIGDERGAGGAKARPMVAPSKRLERSDSGRNMAMAPPDPQENRPVDGAVDGASTALATGANSSMAESLSELDALAGHNSSASFLDGFDPELAITKTNPTLLRKPKEEVFTPEDALPPVIENPDFPQDPEPFMDDSVVMGGGDDSYDEFLVETPMVSDHADAAFATEEPKMDGDKVRQELNSLSNTQIDAELVSRMGDEVVGLKPKALASIARLEIALGASESDASQISLNTEKAVAQSLTQLDDGRVDLSGADVDNLFTELESLIKAV